MPVGNSGVALTMEVRVAISMVAIRTLEALLVSLLALVRLILTFIGMSSRTEQQQARQGRQCNSCVHSGLLDPLVISRTDEHRCCRAHWRKHAFAQHAAPQSGSASLRSGLEPGGVERWPTGSTAVVNRTLDFPSANRREASIQGYRSAPVACKIETTLPVAIPLSNATSFRSI